MFFVDHGFVDISMMFCFSFFLLLGDLFDHDAWWKCASPKHSSGGHI